MRPPALRSIVLSLLLAASLAGCEALIPHDRKIREAQDALDAGDLDRAEALATEALDAAPELRKVEKNRGEAYYMLAKISAERGDLAEAVKLLQESTRLHAEFEPAYLLLGDLQRRLGLEDEAIRSYEHTVRLSPQNASYRIKLCHIYLDLYQQDPARGVCPEALKLAPADPLARAGVALVQARDGSAEAAAAELARIEGLSEAQRADLGLKIRVAQIEGPGRGRLTRIDQVESPLQPRRAQAETTLTRRGAAPGADAERPALRGVEEVTIPSGDLQLRAWLRKPEGAGPFPAIVYLHGGFSVRQEDVDATSPLVEAGALVLLPSLRGEAGNPGEHGLFLGERDDAQAALRWVQGLPEVNPSRVYVFGDAEGGALAGLLEGAAMIGSYGALLPEQELVRYDPPFALSDVDARRARLWVHNLAQLRATPHHAWVSARSPQADYAEELRADAIAAGAPLTVTLVPGDPAAARAAALLSFLDEITVRRDLSATLP